MSLKLQGKISGIKQDFATKKITLELDIDDADVLLDKYGTFKDNALHIELKKQRELRSLDANAYFHVLVGKIAPVLHTSRQRVKNMLIARYGQPELLDDGSEMVYKTNAPEGYMQELETLHTWPVRYETENDVTFTYYRVYRGTHTYNTKEMAQLIDGTVQEAKDLGIDTATPDEIAKMKQVYRQPA